MLVERDLFFIVFRMRRYFIKLSLVITNEYKFFLFIDIEEVYYNFCYDFF